MRGKLKVLPPNIKVEGNIPAYAGKTITRARFDTGEWEHPRVCGENVNIPDQGLVTRGTSPRMRGKLENESLTRLHLGNIPAYAGKTFCRRSFCFSVREHPRVCGENVLE